MAPSSAPSIQPETESASPLTSPPQKPDPHAQQISSLFSKAADGFAAIAKQIGAAYVKEGVGGKHGQQHHLSKGSIELLIQFAHVDGSADDRKLVAAARQEAFKGVFGPASVKLLKSFQESVRLNKDTGQLEMLPENQRGSGLVADGVLGIRTLNALSQWASLRSSTNPQNGVLAEASQAMKPFIFRIEENGDRTRFDEFVRRTNNLWNVEDGQGAGDGEDYSGSFVVGDGEFSNPSFGKLTPGAMRKVKRIAQSLGTDPDNLLAVMSFETGGTFSPSITNGAGSGATGLIQFMPDTARGLGTTTAALARMSQEQQLDYVEKYFQPYKGRQMSLEDLYMAVLWPAAVGKDNSFVLFSGGAEYSQNSGLDKNRDGKVTKFEAAAKVREHLAKIAPQDLVASNEVRAPSSSGPRSTNSLASIAQSYGSQMAGVPYSDTNNCSTAVAEVFRRRFGNLSNTDEDDIMIRNRGSYGSLVSSNRPEAGGPVYWLEKSRKGSRIASLESITTEQASNGVAAQITWKDGGGHSVILTGVRRENGRVVGFDAWGAHSLKDPQTGKTGIYTAYIPLNEVRSLKLAAING